MELEETICDCCPGDNPENFNRRCALMSSLTRVPDEILVSSANSLSLRMV